MTDGPPTPRRATATTDAVDSRVIGTLVSLGVDPEAAARYVRRRDAVGAVFDAVLLPSRLERTVTPAAIAERGGLAIKELAELMEAFGLARPEAEVPLFTPEEALAFIELGNLDEVWPAPVRLQMARVYGAMLARIARAEVQAFQAHTEPQVREASDDVAAQLSAIKSAFERLLPLADPLLLGVHSRWIEHELAQRAVSLAESRADTATLPGAVEVTFLFCDLKDFTSYVEAHGDAAAISAIDRFSEIVSHERGQNGLLVKSLGDGAMLVYDQPVDAVAAGGRVIAAMRATGLPGVHASVHRGIAIARSGDYFGGAVNLAARLLPLAARDELLATADAVAACGSAFEWEPAGERTLRGVTAPVAVYRLVLIPNA
jgi:class 3 adenylate cyclase